MIILGLLLFLLSWSQVETQLPITGSKDWIRKEVGAVIKMTLEFVKDMDMKMRDVRRVERQYYGLYDFGAGKIFQAIQNKFDHMCSLYKNTSRISHIMEQGIILRPQVVGMLQFMLSDYMEILSLIDVFKERYSYWKTTSRLWQIKDKIESFLLKREIYPENYEELLSWIIVVASDTKTNPKNPKSKKLTAEDRDLIIKTTRDYIIDMQQKLTITKRIQRTFFGPAQVSTSLVLGDMLRRFKHMCDLYRHFASVRRYVFEKGLNDSIVGSPDVVVIFEIMLLMWIIVICINNKLGITLVTAAKVKEKTIDEIFRQLRKNEATKDADMIIKMTRDFIIDMQQKMIMIKRIQRTYSGTVQFVTGTVLSDVMRRFKHMCDLYKQFATVRRYVFEKGLNESVVGSPDVVVVFQIMLSDYNEILMQIELYRVEQARWSFGDKREETRNLVRKQMLKFRNLPAGIKPPQLYKDAKIWQKKVTTKRACGKWHRRRAQDDPQKSSGNLDGVGFDNR